VIVIHRWPDFLVIGAQKAGTTSLYSYLRQHPEVFLPTVKEPQYFALAARGRDFAGTGDARLGKRLGQVFNQTGYLELFSGAGTGQKRGECSNYYLWSPEAPVLIRQTIPSVRLVALLRNPVDRAWSAFCHLRRDRRERLVDFDRALDAEPDRIRRDYGPLWRYVETGCYATQLKRYLECFPREQIHIELSESLQTEPVETLKRIYAFIGVDTEFVFNVSETLNVSGLPRLGWVHDIIKRSYPGKSVLKQLMPAPWRSAISARFFSGMMKREPMPEHTRERLEHRFQSEIEELEEILQCDLSGWKQKTE